MKNFAAYFFIVLSHIAAAADAKEDAADYRTTIATTKSISVFEGLPHQRGQRDLLAQEIKRKDTTTIWMYPFYTPSILATNAGELKRLLSSPDAIVVYSGDKFCGGYHPDYCLSWKAEKKTYYALICFGCREVVFSDGGSRLIYDLNPDAYHRLMDLLVIYAKKRPQNPWTKERVERSKKLIENKGQPAQDSNNLR